MLSAGPDVKMQTPDEHDPEGGTRGEENCHLARDTGRFRTSSLIFP